MSADPIAENRDAQLAAALDDLREKESFNFALFQHNPLAITVVNRDGRALKSNLARRQAPDPLPPLNEPLFREGDGYAPDMRPSLAQAMTSGRPCEIQDVTRQGRTFAFTIAPFPHGAIVIRRDITEQKTAQEQLVQAQKLAALGTLVSGVAHEVSNPNNVILLSARSLRRLLDEILPVLDQHAAAHHDFELGAVPYAEMRAELPELAASCHRAAERIQQLVTDLKGYARKDDGDLHRRFDLNAVVRSAVNLMGATLRQATRRFELGLTDPLPPVAGSDRRIEQVIINLISNACEALPDPSRGIRVTTALDTTRRHVCVVVADEGAGIPARLLPQITDPFFTTKHDTGGTGLGLSISRQIVENHRGTLAFQSDEGHGTTVTLSLPVADRAGTSPTHGE